MFDWVGRDFCEQIFVVQRLGHFGLGARRFAGVLRIDRSGAFILFPETLAGFD